MGKRGQTVVSTLDVPTAEHAAEVIGWPTEEWKGACYQVSCELVDKGLVEGKAEYGLYLGPVHPDSMFSNTRPAQRHGWVRASDGHIIDPTLWVFEATIPYIAVIHPRARRRQSFYDLGGGRFRRAVQGDNPCPPFTGQGRTRTNEDAAWQDPDFSDVVLMIGEPPWDVRQLHWLANRTPDELDHQAYDIYAGLIRAGCSAMIPIDFRINVFGRDHMQVEKEIKGE